MHLKAVYITEQAVQQWYVYYLKPYLIVFTVVLPDEHYVRTTTPPPSSTPGGCADLTANCTLYPRDACSDYPRFTSKYCRKTCGICATTVPVARLCEDEHDDCASFGTSMCFDESQYNFVDSNCRKFCGFCGNESLFIDLYRFCYEQNTCKYKLMDL